MSATNFTRRFLRKVLYHGLPWSLLSCFNRYKHCFLPYINFHKLSNLSLAHWEMARGKAEIRSTPYMLRIEPTNVCNLSCPGCATGLGINPRPKGFLKKDNLALVLEKIKPHLILTRLDGLGEPFLHPDICTLINRVHQAGSATVVSSHFGQETLKRGQAEKLIDAGLDHLIVSIDGPDQETYEKYRVGGNLATVCEHVRELVEAKKSKRSRTPIIEVQFIGFNHNRHTISAMPKLARSLGADRLTCKLTREDVLTERQAGEGSGKRCFWLYTTWTIGWDGERKFCSNSIADLCNLPNAFGLEAKLMDDHPVLAEARRFLASKDRDLNNLSPLLGDVRSQELPWNLPRKQNMCRCLACAGVGLVIDRTRKWLDEYVCM